VGFAWGFGPVLVVTVDPRNPVINVRSFGEDPALVARLGVAYLEGLQEEGIAATAKHFPGHGDVAIDSHLALPTVSGARERLEAVELLPFRAACRAGVAAVMTGHLAVPALGAPDVPATLSARICTDLLRGELGFRGLVVSDALDMGGVRGRRDPVEVAIDALLAGCDVLLMPPEPEAVHRGLVAAVASGRVPAARLDAAVRAVLTLKRKAGLLTGGGLPAADWRRTVACDAHRRLAAGIAARGVTLVRDRAGLVPLPPGGAACVVELCDEADTAAGDRSLARALGAERAFVLHPDAEASEIEAAATAVARAALPIVALHVHVRSYSGRIGLPEAFTPVAAALARAPRAVAVSFGNPYLLQVAPELSTYVCAFETTPATVAAVAAALRGEAAIAGRLPVTIPGAAARGDGLSWLPPEPGELPRARPEEEGFAPDLAARIRTVLDGGVAARAFPGATCVVARRGRIVAEVAAGRTSWAEDAPAVTIAARYDLASLTKVCATLPLCLRLVAQGRLDLDQKVRDLLPEFTGPGKERVTIRHLLEHRAGLPPHVRFFAGHEGRDAIVRAACREPLRGEPDAAAVYSDLGLILLGACLERIGGADLAALAQREVFAPLGMAGATFVPRGSAPIDAPPTEACAWRGRVVQGEVHDENAYAMGGVSGHAGLFGSADDVVRVGLAFLGGGRGWLPPALVRAAVRRAAVPAGTTRALGFDTFVPGGSGGSLLHPTAFGHTGFTGTSLWCDPVRDLCVVLLSNRVHERRDNHGIAAVRRELHDTVVRALE